MRDTGTRDQLDGRRICWDADGHAATGEWDATDDGCLDAALRLAASGETSEFAFYEDHVPKLIAGLRRLQVSQAELLDFIAREFEYPRVGGPDDAAEYESFSRARELLLKHRAP